MPARPKLVPAVLSTTTEGLLRQAERVVTLSDLVSYDVADGEFVATRTPRPSEYPKLPDGVQAFWHLMVHEPAEYLAECLAVPTALLALQAEARGLREALAALEDTELFVGLALNPRTPAATILPFAEQIQFVQVMTVEPGAQGNAFLPTQLAKLRELRTLVPELAVAVDGGVSSATIEAVVRYRPDYILVGSALTTAEAPADAWRTLNRLADLGGARDDYPGT